MSARDLHGPGAPWGAATPGSKSNTDFKVVGRALRKLDGLSKATGAALYADDLQLLVTCTMPYGKYKGRLIADLPGNYLTWLPARASHRAGSVSFWP